MSEREFDIYLNLLSRFLKLSAKQRKAIEAELRDHLEHRLDELLEKGYTRDDAIAAALEEFGDAAGLADEFSRIARYARIRRRIMQTSIGTLAAAAVALAFTFVFLNGSDVTPSVPAAQAATNTASVASGAINTSIEIERLDGADQFRSSFIVRQELDNGTFRTLAEPIISSLAGQSASLVTQRDGHAIEITVHVAGPDDSAQVSVFQIAVAEGGRAVATKRAKLPTPG